MRSYDHWKTTDPAWNTLGPKPGSWRTCSECEGQRILQVGRRGANDPDVVSIECDVCDGLGEIFEEEEIDA